ncbi:uncharacterized protein LOC108678964 [Hyalella azteca]|uniref:Uncharacterized protein LOC108678964 n=1 Tax=Hyalella azteca TaxID=294128 RepID=A0A8B7PAE8_HYAAZ|nr:uncharacterized protein LOC108678964 [Hyalella azteca]
MRTTFLCIYIVFSFSVRELQVCALKIKHNTETKLEYDSLHTAEKDGNYIPRKEVIDFDTIIFTLLESDAPLLLTQAFDLEVQRHLHAELFSSTKLKSFNTVISFVHVQCGEAAGIKNIPEIPVYVNPLTNYKKFVNVETKIEKEAVFLDDGISCIYNNGDAKPRDFLSGLEKSDCNPVTFLDEWPDKSTSGPAGWVSLWVFFDIYAAQQNGGGCCGARLPISPTLADKLEVPSFMRDFDLTHLDWQNSYVLYLHPAAKFTTEGRGAEPAELPARFVCVLEGDGSVSVSSQVAEAAATTKGARLRGAYGAGDCLLLPKSWAFEVAASSATSLMLLSWTEDVTLSEAFMERLLENNAAKVSVMSQQKALPSSDRDDSDRLTLSHFMPSVRPSKRMAWLDKPKLPYIFTRFFFSKVPYLDLEEFVNLMKVDANVFPSLVDCSPKSECFFLLSYIFKQLDFNADGQLNQDDLKSLTPARYQELSAELDDLIQEVTDVATDQWEEALAARSAGRAQASRWTEFAGRAQEKKLASARTTAQRVAQGDLSYEEIAIIRQTLPGLYEQLVELGKIDESGSRE